MKKIFAAAALLGLTLTACGTTSQVPEPQAAASTASAAPLSSALIQGVLSGTITSHTFSSGETVNWTLTPEGRIVAEGKDQGPASEFVQYIGEYEAGLHQSETMQAQGIGIGDKVTTTTTITQERICTSRFLWCLNWVNQTTTTTQRFINQRHIWPSGQIRYQLGSMNQNSLNAWNAAVAEWNQLVPTVKWVQVPAGSSADNVVITAYPMSMTSQGASTTGYYASGNYLSFNEYRADKGNITHLMGHVAGLLNEAQRPGRDRYININPAVAGLSHEFGIPGAEDLSSSTTNGNVTTIYSTTTEMTVTPFDFDSVMNLPNWAYTDLTGGAAPTTYKYSATGETAGNTYNLGKAQRLSTGDIITLNQLYFYKSPTTTTVVRN